MKKTLQTEILYNHRKRMNDSFQEYKRLQKEGDTKHAMIHFSQTLKHAVELMHISLTVLNEELTQLRSYENNRQSPPATQEENGEKLEVLVRMLMPKANPNILN